MHVIRESFNPDIAFKNILNLHPWVKNSVIHISFGLELIVHNFLNDIENIFMSKTPDIAYLRITEELFGDGDDKDISSFYQRRLRLYIQAEHQIEARDLAIKYCVNNAIGLSLAHCYICAHELTKLNLRDKNIQRDAPFLPVAPDGMMGYSYVCMSCAYDNWEGDQAAKETVNALDVGGTHSSDREEEDEEECPDSNGYDNDDKAEMKAIHDEQRRKKEIEKQNNAAPPAGSIKIFDMKAVKELMSDNSTAPRDQIARIKGIVKKIEATPYHKKLVQIPENWQQYCDNLEAKYPNFHDVVFFLKNQFALSARGSRALSLPPILLVGGPGIGKSDIVITLANDLGSHTTIIDMSCAQTGSALTGSEAYWANTTPGSIFKSLTMHESAIANPIYILDELDKVKSRSDQDPLAGLHQLLEERQAKNFRDLSVQEIALDASHIIFFATANEICSIPAPILDRFIVFHIADPDPEQMLAIVGNQYKRFLDTNAAGSTFKKTIRKDVRKELANSHPRKVRRMLEQAFGLAALDNRNHLTLKDIQDVDTGKKRNTSIGFMSPV